MHADIYLCSVPGMMIVDPLILDTDDKDKSLRYQHPGMKPDRVRNCGEKFRMYDLIRESQG